jgi:hypothetical protein
VINLFLDIANHLTGRPYVGTEGKVRNVEESESEQPSGGGWFGGFFGGGPSDDDDEDDYRSSAPTSDRERQQASKNIVNYRGVQIRDMGGGDVARAKQAIDDLKAIGEAGGLRRMDIAKDPRHRDGTIPEGWNNYERGVITLRTNGHSREQMLRNAAHEMEHERTSSEDEAEAAERRALAKFEKVRGR